MRAAGAATQEFLDRRRFVLWALVVKLADHSDLPLRPGSNARMVLGFVIATWMSCALALQVALSAVTVGLTILTARMWLGRGIVLCGGTGCWRHHAQAWQYRQTGCSVCGGGCGRRPVPLPGSGGRRSS